MDISPQSIAMAQHDAAAYNKRCSIVLLDCVLISINFYCALALQVLAVDISPQRIAMAQHNASIYGVANRASFLCADWFKLAPTLRVSACN